MNIWILNHYAITPNMPGGTRHYDFGKELEKRGHSVTILASSFHYTQRKEIKLKKNEGHKVENIDGINFIWIKTFSYQKNNWRRIINMISYMWKSYCIGKKITNVNKNVGKPDIIIGSSVHLLAVVSAYWLSKYYRVKFIMEVRDLWPQTLIDIGKFKKNNFIIKTLQILEKFLYKKAKKIIMLLPLGINYTTSVNVNRKKIVYIPNGVDLKRFGKLKKNHIINKNYFRIIYTGSYGKADALNTILETAKIIQLKNYHKIQFLFFGEGPEKNNLLEYKKQLKLNNVKFCNSVSKKEISLVLGKSDLLIYALKKTNLYKYGISPNKIHDYMASAKPIVMTGTVKKNPIEEIRCGICVPPENPEKMAEAIIKLYNMSPEERQEMGQRGREYVERYHSIPVLVNKLEKVFKEINN